MMLQYRARAIFERGTGGEEYVDISWRADQSDIVSANLLTNQISGSAHFLSKVSKGDQTSLELVFLIKPQDFERKNEGCILGLH